VSRLEARLRDARTAGEALRPFLERVARLRRELYEATSPERKQELERQLDVAVSEATTAKDAHSALVDALVRETGIPEEVWDALDTRSRLGDPVDRTARASVRATEIAPTGTLEVLTPPGLEFLRRTVPRDWLDQQLALGTARLERTYLSEPVVLVRGMRVASERRPMHRLAQSVAVCEDFLREAPDFDWHAGALLVPQVAALGQRVAELRAVEGEVDARIASLWRDASTMMDSTCYELFVATACVRMGRRVEFLTATQHKTPDLRVHDLLLPLTVECKRRARLVQADLEEDAWARALYPAARRAFVSRDLTGTVALHLTAPFDRVSPSDLEDAAVRLRRSKGMPKPLAYPWGTLTYTQAPRRTRMAPTRLYSPYYLARVFAWDTDLPRADGIVCQARTPRGFIVDEAREPFAVTWTQDEPTWRRKRVRGPVALLGDAIRQIPTGEAAVIYLCYQEVDREEVADERMEVLKQRFHDWTLDRHIHVPVLLVTRLIPRAVADGAPDLIDTGVRFTSATMGDPAWFDVFPSAVVTGSGG
jgi:hypothetical protein